MSKTFRLLVDDNYNNIEIFTEQENKDAPKKMYLEGVFGMAGKKNKNNRIYDVEDMRRDISRYNKEIIQTNRAYNELNHPTSPDVDLERACDRTVCLRLEEDGTIYGKSLILDTPLGKIQKALIEGGGMIGKSSRAMGQIEETHGASMVRGVRLVCFDSVQDPSVGSAIVDPLLENREWVLNETGEFIAKPFEKLEEGMKTLPVGKREEYKMNLILDFLNSI